MNLLTFLLCSAGATVILTLSRLFKPIRPKACFFHCLMCMGFWVSVLFWTLSPYTNLFSFEMNPLTGFFLGCAGSLASWVLGYLGSFLENKS